MLTQSAIEALLPFGSEEQRADFTMPMLQGRWSGTMNLTEPQAGLDLSSVQCKAKVALDGSFRISGQKILVTYGDHDLTDNTIHMVLARLPDAPPIVKGISMFIVPKFLQGTAGAWNVRNEVRRFSIEHKLGIRGSPICTMHFGEDEGAVAFLVGAANKGLDYMFTMMNTARFAVGLEGLGVASAAHQVALQYSTERVQGFPNSPHWRTIAGHPYVKQMLLCIESHVMFMRSLCVTAGGKIDQLSLDGGPMSHEHAPSPVDLLTHVVKGWCTEHAQEALSLAPQVHLASGYIEETGIAQLLRDVRVTTLYEGTTAIQANDLVFRKVLRDSGKAANRLAAELETTAAISQSEAVEHQAIPSANGGEIMSTFHTTLPWLDARGRSDLPRTRAGAVALLDLFGYCAAAWCVGRLVIHAQRLTKRGVMHAAQERRVTLARVFLELAAGRSICSPRKANRVAYAVTEFPDSVLIAA
jgi:alkylation response protein AidB-like acyl-CoA dehydrogenase